MQDQAEEFFADLNQPHDAPTDGSSIDMPAGGKVGGGVHGTSG